MFQADEIWKQVKTNLKDKNLNNKLLKMWFEPTSLVSYENRSSGVCFKLGVPTELHKYWISQNLLDRICSEISAVYKNPFQVEFIITGDNSSHSNDLAQPSLFDLPLSPQQQSVTNLFTQDKNPTISMREPQKNGSYLKHNDTLNPDYLFSTFVVGRNNEFAHAATYSISENPGTENYNPLFICGPTGMGKTHLLNAAGNNLLKNHPHLRICYVSAERFLNDCISHIRRNEMHKFRLKYREQCDVLLMDDIQVLGKGEAVQEEFFHTLNDFFEKGQQVIVASDRMPKDIQGLEDRIRTRLEWGLIADIQMPDIETRMAILKYKAERKKMRLPNDVITYISRISKRSIRELEGNLNKVKMFSELQGLEINLKLVKDVLSHHDDDTHITVEEVQKLAAQFYNVRISDLKSKSRTKPLVVARQIAMYLVKKHLDKSLVEIGQAFGGKDHTTVINAIKRITDQQTKNLDLKRDIEEIESKIHNITGV